MKVWGLLDEMNITIPQNIQTVTELEEISDLKNLMISAQSSGMIMGAKQDALVGCYNITRPDTQMSSGTAMNLLTHTNLKSLIVPKNSSITGHELFSQIIPKGINKSNGGDKNKPLIKNGQLISGYIDKASIGSGGGGNNLIYMMLDKYDPNVAKDFFDNLQKLANAFNMFYGFSMGMVDTNVPKDIRTQIHNKISSTIVIANTRITEMENNPKMMDPDLFEKDIGSVLDIVRDDSSKVILANMNPQNGFKTMIDCGSKGGPSNIGQMLGCIAQQMLEGKRMPKKLNNRTLPCFTRHDDTAIARGFIRQGFLSGLEFPEFVFLSVSAREGLIDQAIKTADSGYTQRKIIKTQEDIHVAYDMTVRTSGNHIVQFIYGDTGANTTKQVNCDIEMLTLGDKELQDKYSLSQEQRAEFSNYNDEEFMNELFNMRDTMRKSQVIAHLESGPFISSCMLPINLARLVLDARNNTQSKGTKLTPAHIISSINKILSHDVTKLVCYDKTDADAIKIKDDIASKWSLKVALYNALAPKRSIYEYKLNKESFDDLIDDIVKSYNKNIIEAGEMVGIISAQSICQPVTQMTLNAFHHSGIGSKSTSNMGLPRIRELLGLSTNIKTPEMSIYLHHDKREDKEFASRVAAQLKYITIGYLRNKLDVYYDPITNQESKIATEDDVKNVFSVEHQTSTSCQKDISKLPWLIRIEWDREKLLVQDVTLLDIKSKFCNMWETRFDRKLQKFEKNLFEKITQCAILSNDENSVNPIVHIRFSMTNFTIESLDGFIDNIVDTFKIKGIDTIDDVSLNDENVVDFTGENHSLVNKKENVITTSGVNMFGIRYINGIDLTRTITNDVMLINDLFGIEAARFALLQEIVRVFKQGGSRVNFQHLMLMGDLMSRDGALTSVDRHGINKTDSSVLGKASFEQTVEQFLSAAAFNEVDDIQGVSARVMTGNVIRGGTGMCDIVFDTDFVENSEYYDTDQSRYQQTTTSTIIDDVINRDDGTTGFIPK